MKHWITAMSVVAVCAASVCAAPAYFDDQYAIAGLAHYGGKDIETLAKIYLHELKYAEYSKARNDERAMQAQVNEAKRRIQERSAQMMPGTQYYIASSEMLGAYDSALQSFALSPMTKNTYFKLMAYSPDQRGPKSKAISVTFTNPELVGPVMMPDEEAAAFIKERTDSTGNVNKTVYLKIIFTIDGMHPHKADVLLGTITAVQVYGDAAAVKLLYTFGSVVPTKAQQAARDLEEFITSHPMPAVMQNELRGIVDKYK